MTKKGKSNPRRRKGRVALLAALLMGVMLAAPAQPALAAGGTGQKAIDLTEQGSMTVTSSQIAEGENEAQKEEMSEDMAKANIVVDLYKVASAVKTTEDGSVDVTGYDTYAFDVTKDFTELKDVVNDKDAKSETWADTAQRALNIAIKGAQKAKENCNLDETIEKLDLGMYLVVARGADLTVPEEYAETGDDDKIRTIANSATYKYSFLPVLVAIPARGMATAEGGVPDIINDDTVFSNETSNNDIAWQYELKIALKASREPRLSNMSIVKDLTGYENGKTDASGKADPATFVFQVDGVLRAKQPGGKDITFSNVYSVVLNEAGKADPIVIGNLPIGMEMTVTEVYSGANYKAVTEPQTLILEVPMDPDAPTVVPDTQVLTFVNDYDKKYNGGGSVTNTYTKNEKGRISGKPDQKYDDGRGAE